jgi:hypothetical protein
MAGYKLRELKGFGNLRMTIAKACLILVSGLLRIVFNEVTTTQLVFQKTSARQRVQGENERASAVYNSK